MDKTDCHNFIKKTYVHDDYADKSLFHSLYQCKETVRLRFDTALSNKMSIQYLQMLCRNEHEYVPRQQMRNLRNVKKKALQKLASQYVESCSEKSMWSSVMLLRIDTSSPLDTGSPRLIFRNSSTTNRGGTLRSTSTKASAFDLNDIIHLCSPLHNSTRDLATNRNNGRSAFTEVCQINFDNIFSTGYL